MNKRYYYEVAVASGIKKNLIYSFHQILPVGQLIQVPLRNRRTQAVVLRRIDDFQKSFPVRDILSIQPHLPPLSSSRLNWLSWVADYYQHTHGAVIHLSYPSFITHLSTKAWNQILQPSDNDKLLSKPSDSVVLTAEQEMCVQKIQSQSNTGFQVHFIHGVTGSGKTEIYFQLIELAIKEKKSVLVLVPEISLTPQHIARFSLRFPNQVACLHSGMSPKQKATAWIQMVKGNKTILIGPRSALFCPIPRTAWIILDEEHESHFKQDEKLKYHARDAAIILGQQLNIPVVLASATPSLESWWNIQTGKYRYYQLKNRVFKAPVPRLELVDMRQRTPSINSRVHPKRSVAPHPPWWLSDELYQALKDTLHNKEQAALFINRRGEASCILCSACGFHFSCPNCDISLTQHQQNHMVCHYCAWREEKPTQCPKCGQDKLSAVGLGTELVQKEMIKLFPNTQVMRADRDEVRNHTDWTECIRKIENKEVDILVGTQMIAKGLDFPNLTLVGVVLADQDLRRPDFRSSEKSFQLLTQMAGRAGRRTRPGRVILQSYYPDHPVLQALTKGSYQQFAEQELKYRNKYSYPPFVKLILVRTQGISDTHTLKAAIQIKNHIQKIKGLNLLGPARPAIFRLRNKYRYHLLLKSHSLSVLQQAGRQINSILTNLPSAVQVHINQDPAHLM